MRRTPQRPEGALPAAVAPSCVQRPHGAVRARRAFTLLEMLFVVLIIGLIAALVLPRLGRTFGRGQVKTTQAQLAALTTMVEDFRADVGRYPTEPEGLGALITKPQGLESWQGPYGGKRTLPKDAWGREFIYKSDATFGFVIRSLGADQKEGGEGDNADLDNRS